MKEGGRGGLRAGTARCDITPPPGLDLAGFAVRHGAALGTRDPLELRALVASHDEARVAVLVFDLLGLPADWVARARDRVAAVAGVPPEHQLYACTHTHCGPETRSLPAMGATDEDYLEALIERAAAAVGEAVHSRQPVELCIGTGSSHAGANRRSAAVAPDGPHDGEIDDIDPTVVAAQFRTPRGVPVATLVNYGCHPTSSAEHVYSADYPGHLRAEVEAATGGPVLYINAAGGDVNLRFPNPRQRGFAVARELGAAIGREAVRALDGAPVSASREVGAASSAALLVYDELIPVDEARRIWEEGRRALADARTPRERREAQHYVIGYAERVLAAADRPAPPDGVRAEVQTLRIGDLAIVAVPVELFSADGRAMRSATPAPRLMIAGWSNGTWGYVPTRRAAARGGYEAEQAFRRYELPAPWHPVSGDNLRAAALEATGRLFP